MQNLYKIYSKKITVFFIENETIDFQQQKVYEYGFEILLSTLVYFIIFILTSILTKSFLFSLFWGIGFFIARTISGGYHAPTYLKCNFISLSSHIISIILFKNIPESFHKNAFMLFFILSAIIILVYGPIDHPNKPFIKNEKKRFKIASCVYSITIILIPLLIVLLSENNFDCFLLSYSIGTFTAAISLVAAKINKKKGEYNK